MGVLAAAPLWWGVEWSSALLAIATGVLAVGVVLTLAGLLSARGSVIEEAKARNTQVYAEISRRWDSKELLNVRAKIDLMDPQAFMDCYRSLRNSNEVSGLLQSFKLKRLANFFEDLGVLESRGSLDIRWIEESLGSVVTNYWMKWELAAVEERIAEKATRPDASLIWENWEALSRKIEQHRIRSEGHHPKKRWRRRKHF
jgi:hypothetical protein